MSETVTIQLTKESHYNAANNNPFNIGGIIKIKGQKRFCFQIIDPSAALYKHTISMVTVYKPSPKSVLKNKSIFTKVKNKLI